jgi:hypothetical protein
MIKSNLKNKGQLALAIIFCLIGFGAQSQSTDAGNIRATIIAPDNICSLSLNSPDGDMFTLANGQDNCFDITLCPIDPLKASENNLQPAPAGLKYSLSNSELLSGHDLRINIAQPASPSSQYTLSVHYN